MSIGLALIRYIKDPTKQYLIHAFNSSFWYLNNILALNKNDFSMYTKVIYTDFLTLHKAKTYIEVWTLPFPISLMASFIQTFTIKEMIFHILLLIIHFRRWRSLVIILYQLITKCYHRHKDIIHIYESTSRHFYTFRYFCS